MRTPVFELHIRPMFRATDKAHMGFAVDLWDYDDVVANADAILARLQSDMPPTETGGLWPEEWITLFQRWTDGARKRLDLGTATFALQQGAPKTIITATGTFPAAACRGLAATGERDEHLEDVCPVLRSPGRPCRMGPPRPSVWRRTTPPPTLGPSSSTTAPAPSSCTEGAAQALGVDRRRTGSRRR